MSNCIICGREYEPYHCRQVTCGCAECKRTWRRQYMSEWLEKGENRQKVRTQKREHMRRVRGTSGTEMKELLPKPLPFDDDPSAYGRAQIEKTLASLPKIDVNLKNERRKDGIPGTDNGIPCDGSHPDKDGGSGASEE